MADPRTLAAPQDRRNALSPLIRAMYSNTRGEKLNFCPHGCRDDELDENGYCRHLVGFTNDPKPGGVMEPMVVNDKGRRVVMGGSPQKVLKGDTFVQITCSYRVYRGEAAETRK
jgi:hypothetical protein